MQIQQNFATPDNTTKPFCAMSSSPFTTSASTSESSPAQLAEKQLLCFDAMNFSKFFFPNAEDFFESLRLADTIVEQFVNAAINSSYQLQVFIDATMSSIECQEKWRAKVEK